MKRHVIKTGMLILGWLLVLLGIIGFFLPILQGVLLLALGIFILSKNSPWWSEKVEVYKQRHPSFKKAMDTVDGWVGEKKTNEESASAPPASEQATATPPPEPEQKNTL